jgi:hypothetical protein
MTVNDVENYMRLLGRHERLELAMEYAKTSNFDKDEEVIEIIQELSTLKMLTPPNISQQIIESLIGSQDTNLFKKVIYNPFISCELKEDALSHILNGDKQSNNK